MRDYTKAPNRVLFDRRVTHAERGLYAMLLHLAWLNRDERRENDVLDKPVQLAPHPELSDQLGVSLPTLERFLRKMRKLGYIETTQASRRAALVYTFRAVTGDGSETDGRAARDPSPATGQEPAEPPSTVTGDGAGAGLSVYGVEDGKAKSEDKTLSAAAVERPDGTVDWALPGDPPKLTKDEQKQIPAVNVLARLCGVQPGSPRLVEVGVAIHGNARHLDRLPGINRMFWKEMAEHYHVSLDVIRERAAANPGGYQQALVVAIQIRSGLYRQKWDVPLTPGGLAKHWLDLRDDGEGAADRPLTPEQIASLA